MRTAVVGGGILGLSVAHYLRAAGHGVELFEQSDRLGGLAGSYDYGEFIWDRFYHVVLPQDLHLLQLFDELGLSSSLRWRTTRTGYFAGGHLYSMSSSREMLQFPLLSWFDKFRMGVGTVRAVRFADRNDLYRLTAAQWLTKVFGRSNYEIFWRPLLRAKFGEYAEQVAALAIQTTLARLFGARSTVARKEAMGYVHGGYHQVLAAFRTRLEERGVAIRLDARISRIGEGSDFGDLVGVAAQSSMASASATTRVRITSDAAGATTERTAGCGVEVKIGAGPSRVEWFDHVIFTGPTGAALSVLSAPLRRDVEEHLDQDRLPRAYLGVVSLNLVLRRPITPYYVLNVSDSSVPLTGVIEMTALIDRAEETCGRTLVYLPKYVDSNDQRLRADDTTLRQEFFDRGLQRLFPDLSREDVVSWHVQRAPHVQPLRFVTDRVPPPGNRPPAGSGSFTLANTSLLACPTLNNNEVVGLAKEVATQISSSSTR